MAERSSTSILWTNRPIHRSRAMSHHRYLVEALMSDRLREAEMARRRGSVSRPRAWTRRRPRPFLRPRHV